MFQDIRYALRVLRRSPGFTALAIATLAVGIGATVTMFSVTDAVLIRPFAYPDPDRLVQVWGRNPARNIPFHNVSYPDVTAWQQETRSFEMLTAVMNVSASLAGRGDPEVVRVLRANASFLPMLDPRMAAGRP
ncbi:MAG: ABC transporter permease, partial [Acidobacteria bacterium]